MCDMHKTSALRIDIRKKTVLLGKKMQKRAILIHKGNRDKNVNIDGIWLFLVDGWGATWYDRCENVQKTVAI